MIPHNKKGTYRPEIAYWRKLARFDAPRFHASAPVLVSIPSAARSSLSLTPLPFFSSRPAALLVATRRTNLSTGDLQLSGGIPPQIY
jgi:hypothetical protein